MRQDRRGGTVVIKGLTGEGNVGCEGRNEDMSVEIKLSGFFIATREQSS